MLDGWMLLLPMHVQRGMFDGYKKTFLIGG